MEQSINDIILGLGLHNIIEILLAGISKILSFLNPLEIAIWLTLSKSRIPQRGFCSFNDLSKNKLL